MLLLDSDSFPRSVCPPTSPLCLSPVIHLPSLSARFPHTANLTKVRANSYIVFFFMFWPYCAACGILVPRPVIKPVSPASEVWSLNHWTAGKVPQLLTLTSNLIIGILENGITTILAAQSPTFSHSAPLPLTPTSYTLADSTSSIFKTLPESDDFSPSHLYGVQDATVSSGPGTASLPVPPFSKLSNEFSLHVK